MGLLEGFVVFGVAIFAMLSIKIFEHKHNTRSRVLILLKDAAISITFATVAGVILAMVLAHFNPDANSFTPLVSGIWALVNIGFYTWAWVSVVGILMFLVAAVQKTRRDEGTGTGPIKRSVK